MNKKKSLETNSYMSATIATIIISLGFYFNSKETSIVIGLLFIFVILKVEKRIIKQYFLGCIIAILLAAAFETLLGFGLKIENQPFMFVASLITLVASIVILIIKAIFKPLQKESIRIDDEETKIIEFENNPEILECPIPYDKNMKYEVESKIVSFILVMFFLLVIGLSIVSEKTNFGDALMILFIGGAIIMFVGNAIFKFTPVYSKKRKDVELVYEFLKRNINRVQGFNHEKHIRVGDFNKSTKTYQKNLDGVLFDIYREAYNLGANAIVIDDSTTTTTTTHTKAGTFNNSSTNLQGQYVKYK